MQGVQRHIHPLLLPTLPAAKPSVSTTPAAAAAALAATTLAAAATTLATAALAAAALVGPLATTLAAPPAAPPLAVARVLFSALVCLLDLQVTQVVLHSVMAGLPPRREGPPSSPDGSAPLHAVAGRGSSKRATRRVAGRGSG